MRWEGGKQIRRGGRERGEFSLFLPFSLSHSGGFVRGSMFRSFLPPPPSSPLSPFPSGCLLVWEVLISLPFSLSAFLFLFLFVSALSLFVRSSVCLSACLSICLYLSCLSSACLFVYLPSCQSVYLFVYMSDYLLHLEFLCL